jgi:hypothetical protein
MHYTPQVSGVVHQSLSPDQFETEPDCKTWLGAEGVGDPEAAGGGVEGGVEGGAGGEEGGVEGGAGGVEGGAGGEEGGEQGGAGRAHTHSGTHSGTHSQSHGYYLWVADLVWGWSLKGLNIFVTLASRRPDLTFVAYASGHDDYILQRLREAEAQWPNFSYKVSGLQV